MSRPEEAKSWEKVEKEQLKGWEESLRDQSTHPSALGRTTPR